jgi:hypothetical protein
MALNEYRSANKHTATILNNLPAEPSGDGFSETSRAGWECRHVEVS